MIKAVSQFIRANKSSKEKGFTIVELLIVIVVIAVLAAITAVAFNGLRDRAVATSLQADLSNASKMLKLYHAANSAYPTSINTTTYCPTPADANFCLKASPGNTLTNYIVNNGTNPATFSIDALNANGTRYFVSNSVAPTSPSTVFTANAITGSALTDSTLTAGTVPTLGATYTRQWQSHTAATGTFTNIAGATGNTYVIPVGEVNRYIRVQTIGTGAFSGVVTSAATARITTALTSIGATTGAATVGQTLTAGAVLPAGATFTRQWLAAGVNIAGATGATYVPVSGDLGKVITVTVTGTGNYSGTRTSVATAAVN